MRLIGTISTEKEAFSFYAFLLRKEIQAIYEPYHDPESHIKAYRIWVYDEEDLEKAQEYFQVYKQNPYDSQFLGEEPSIKPPPASPVYAEISAKEDLKWQSIPKTHPKKRAVSFILMRFVICVCILLFFYNDKEESELIESKGSIAAELSVTPIQQLLLFDLPASYVYIDEVVQTIPLQGVQNLKELPPDAVALLQKAEQVPVWKGILPFFEEVKEKGWEEASQIPLFEKIREGEIWRLFTPCLMHRDFLHILFNMIWAWVLLKQVEARMYRWKILLLIGIIGVISNLAQYLMGGPFFLGFSGVVVGLAAFIWMRQKKTPWEGYTLPRSTVLFLLFFVLAMFAIELFALIVQLFSSVHLTPYIANTAHIVGGLTGLFLGRFSFFGRKML